MLLAGLLPVLGTALLPGAHASFANMAMEHLVERSSNFTEAWTPTSGESLSERWATAHAAAKFFLANASLEQKVNITTGIGWQNGLCVGNIAPQPDLNWPGLCLQDSPLGVRYSDYVTAFPAGINAAATFDRSLIRKRGYAMGQEFHDKGVNVALGPVMNFARAPEGGRLWESFGGDPYLQGEAAAETVIGIQAAGVQACAKHYINNEQEHFRSLESSNVDDRTEHEIYLHPFLKSVQAGTVSVMCSYNQINNTYACSNDRTLNTWLKGQIGFQGYVMSDWSATMNTSDAAAGLDMTMPGGISFGSKSSYFGANLIWAVGNGTIDASVVDNMAERIVAAWYFTGQDQDYPATNFNSWNIGDPATNQHLRVGSDHYKVVREIGAASTVLLKNKDWALPLQKPASIVLFGSDSAPPPRGPNGFTDRGGTDGTLAMGWGSGTVNLPYLISPLEAIQHRAIQDQTLVSWFLLDWNTDAVAAAVDQEVAIVFVKSDSGEGYIMVDTNFGDRNNLTAWENGDELIKTVAANNNNTIVVVHSVGPLIVEPWIDHPNVTAVLWAGLPGQESGNVLVDVLYGHTSPSGRLPYTIGKNESDYCAIVDYTGVPNATLPQINYTEGLLIDHRWFDAKNITPRFEFGFGLSYTTFDYSDLSIENVGSSSDNATAWENGEATGNFTGASLSPWLHEPAWNVTFSVTNNGTIDGWEVPQLYLHAPASANSPPSGLRGFTRIHISAGDTTSVSFQLSRYDLSVWDVVRQGWAKPNGTYSLSIGASSRDFRLKGTISQ